MLINIKETLACNTNKYLKISSHFKNIAGAKGYDSGDQGAIFDYTILVVYAKSYCTISSSSLLECLISIFILKMIYNDWISWL